jgi:membrane protease subunit (stomatin/prohibitin family)
MAIQFTANYDDLSTDRGYQFKFKCDKCGSGHMTAFQPSITGTVGGLFRAAGSIFGGGLRKVGDASYQVQRATGGKAHDDALAKAVAECKGYFKQCTRCGKWVCPDVCWNASAGLCESCAPDLKEEMAAGRAQAMASAAKNQLQTKAQSTDYVADVDMKGDAPKSTVACPQCGAKTTGGKFCGDCGAPLAVKTTCAGCGHVMDGKPKFCPDCGAKVQ